MSFFCIFGMKNDWSTNALRLMYRTEQKKKNNFKFDMRVFRWNVPLSAYTIIITLPSQVSPTHEWRKFYSKPNILYETQTPDLLLGNTMYVCERRNKYTVLIANTLQRRTTLLIFFAHANFSSLQRFLLFSNNTLQLFTIHATSGSYLHSYDHIVLSAEMIVFIHQSDVQVSRKFNFNRYFFFDKNLLGDQISKLQLQI